jgi:hypothetical protein
MANKKTSPSDIVPAAPAVPPRVPRKRTSVAARPKKPNGDARYSAGPAAVPDAGHAAGAAAGADTGPAATPEPTHEQIAEAAYHKYLSRQGAGGSDFDDWLEAERDLRSRSASNPKAQSPNPKRQ